MEKPLTCACVLLELRRDRVPSRLAGLGSGPCAALAKPCGASHFFGTLFLSVKWKPVK